SWTVSRRIVKSLVVRAIRRAPAIKEWQERVTTSVGVVVPNTIPARKRIARERVPISKAGKRRVQHSTIDTVVGFRQHFAALFTPDVYLFTLAGLFLFFGKFRD